MLSLQKQKFSLPNGSTYLNGAYMSPLLKAVERIGIESIRRKRNPAMISAEDFFKSSIKLRAAFAKLINASEPDRTAIVPSVSYGMATAARNVKIDRGENVVIAAEQFPSNVYPWMRLCDDRGARLKVIPPPENGVQRGKIWNEKILNAISSATRLVALGNVHWADGTKFDLQAIRKRTTEVGALLVIDGTQSVGALPFDMAKIQPDALVCAGYKWLLGPYSIGLAHYGKFFDGGQPIEESWINRKSSEDFAALINYQSGYQPGALRYDVGERSNFILVPMMTAALEQINKWKPERIQEYCAEITREPIQALLDAGFWVEDEGFRGHHLFGVRLPKSADLEKIKRNLRKNKISVSVRGDAIRVSPHLYNTENDLIKLVKVLTA